ncbi:hypothetical protein LCGC14_0687840 [marine sediment metagenome]|uniref:Uncharacterized protein n=1 Tax=marine sediment metagenome TaxID=412755 RepID=A0A0F9TUC2_9ZZZZ
MKPLKRLMDENKLSQEQLSKILYDCLKYYLSEEELEIFILEYYMKKEEKINKRLQV